MRKFIEIAITFNNHAELLIKTKKLNNLNGIYLRTIMLFYGYSKLSPDMRTVQNGVSYLKENLELNFNSASMSRNNHALVELGLIELMQSKIDKRTKLVKLTPIGEKFKKLFD